MSDTKKLLLLKILVAILGIVFLAGFIFLLTYQPVSDATMDETILITEEES